MDNFCDLSYLGKLIRALLSCVLRSVLFEHNLVFGKLNQHSDNVLTKSLCVLGSYLFGYTMCICIHIKTHVCARRERERERDMLHSLVMVWQ